jgi:hypothetical protein
MASQASQAIPNTQNLLRSDSKQSWGLKNDPSVVCKHNDLWVTDWLAGAWKNTSITGVPRVSGFEKSIKRYLGSISQTRQSGWGHKSVWHKPRSSLTFWSCELFFLDPIMWVSNVLFRSAEYHTTETDLASLVFVSLCEFFKECKWENTSRNEMEWCFSIYRSL